MTTGSATESGKAAGAMTWTQRAQVDLRAAHEIIERNHPAALLRDDAAFHLWMRDGYAAALRLAESARTGPDYQRAVRFFGNGFGDGHVAIIPNAVASPSWPEALTVSADGLTRIALAEPGSGLHVGQIVEQCDDVEPDRLLEQRVWPYFYNRRLPQTRRMRSSRLLVAQDPADRLNSCTLQGVGRRPLNYRPILDADLQAKLDVAAGLVTPPLGIRAVGDVTFLSIPSFEWTGDALARYHEFIDEIRRRSAQLHHTAYVVIDVRGNTGGSDALGIQFLDALWDKDDIDNVMGSLATVIDWRATPRNLERIHEVVQSFQRQHAYQPADETAAIARRMETALSENKVWVRESDPVKAYMPKASPFSGRLLLLTDERCGSACLDFADILLRLPDVTHIGRTTGADSRYLEVNNVKLPSGQSELFYPMKVYQKRARRGYEAYKPKFIWPSGDMTTEAVAGWISGSLAVEISAKGRDQ